jgi:hypothetical protein
MGQDGEAVATKIQAMQRAKLARREVEIKKQQKEEEELGKRGRSGMRACRTYNLVRLRGTGLK